MKNINVQERTCLFMGTNVILSGVSRTITGKGMERGVSCRRRFREAPNQTLAAKVYCELGIRVEHHHF